MATHKTQHAIVTCSFIATDDEELSVAQGDEIEVLEKVNLLWSKCKLKDNIGLVPNTCFNIQRNFIPNQERRSSSVIFRLRKEEEKKRACIRIQRYWRLRNRRKILSEKSLKRKEIIAELLSTEESYVESLRILTEISKTLKKFTQCNEIVSLFNNIDIIFVLNTALLKNLRLAHTSLNTQSYLKDRLTIGDTFKIFAPFAVEAYRDYLINYSAASSAIKDVLSKNEEIVKYLNSCKELGGENIAFFLIKPVQRLPRYQVFLGELVKHTPQDHPEYQSLEHAKKLVQDIGKELTELKKQHDIINTLTKVERIFPGILDSVDLPMSAPSHKENKVDAHKKSFRKVSHRKFIRDGVAKLVTKKESITCDLFLFSDVLLCASSEEKITQTPRFKKAFHLLLSKVTLDSKTKLFHIYLVPDEETYTFESTDSEQIVKDINEQIQRESEQLAKNGIYKQELQGAVLTKKLLMGEFPAKVKLYSKHYNELMKQEQKLRVLESSLESTDKEANKLVQEAKKKINVMHNFRKRLVDCGKQLLHLDSQIAEHDEILLRVLKEDAKAMNKYFGMRASVNDLKVQQLLDEIEQSQRKGSLSQIQPRNAEEEQIVIEINKHKNERNKLFAVIDARVQYYETKKKMFDKKEKEQKQEIEQLQEELKQLKQECEKLRKSIPNSNNT